MSGQRYELIQLGGTGDWVQKSLDREGLFICPVCFQNEKEMPLRISNNGSYLCQNCDAMFYPEPPDGGRQIPVNRW